MNARPIRTEELEVIRHLLKIADDKIERYIPGFVTEMADGGMGSLKFEGNNERKYQTGLIGAKYIDKDEVAVFITLNLNDRNELFELDIWKTDFSKLIKFPKPTELIFE